jgi:hypothetical protein
MPLIDVVIEVDAGDEARAALDAELAERVAGT